jgi:hypothetical protein
MPFFEVLVKLLEEENGDFYFCNLDADDAYEPDFFEKMLRFIKQNSLEVAACRSDYINAATGERENRYILENDLLISGEYFGEYFPVYFRFMTTFWGKLFSSSVLRKIPFDIYLKKVSKFDLYVDTIFVLEVLACADKAGILALPLHRYYISRSSVVMSTISPKRFRDNLEIFYFYKEFLTVKCGFVSERNEGYLYALYYRSIKSSVSVLLNADVELLLKLNEIAFIVNHELTREAMKRINDGRAETSDLREKNDWLDTIRDWVDSRNIFPGSRNAEKAEAIIAALDSYKIIKGDVGSCE